MELYVSEFSKYVITLLITLYTYECFAVFRYDNEEARNGIYIRQNILMFAFHFCSFLVICFETGDFLCVPADSAVYGYYAVPHDLPESQPADCKQHVYAA